MASGFREHLALFCLLSNIIPAHRKKKLIAFALQCRETKRKTHLGFAGHRQIAAQWSWLEQLLQRARAQEIREWHRQVPHGSNLISRSFRPNA